MLSTWVSCQARRRTWRHPGAGICGDDPHLQPVALRGRARRPGEVAGARGRLAGRYEAINDFERQLTASGVTLVKFFLHISRDEQRRRLQARLDDPSKHWKFSSNDIAERARWEDYQLAFEEALTRCSTPYAPWYVVPANAKWFRNLVVARTIADTLAAMDPRYPDAEPGLDQINIPA